MAKTFTAIVALIAIGLDADIAIAQCESAPNPILCENAAAGTTDWRLDGNLSTDSGAQIQGFASSTSVDTGGVIDLHVTVSGGEAWNLEVYRMGWYGGAGGRLMWSEPSLPGVQQPGCTNPADVNASFVCDWPVSNGGYSLAVPTHWTTGIYLAKLESAVSNFQSYILFVVREDDRTGDYYYQQAVLTYQSYNRYPNQDVSFYTGGAAARPWLKTLSFNRPYGTTRFFRNNESPFGAQGDGSAGFFTWDFPMIQWLEKEGYDVSYATNIDLHENPGRVLDFAALISVGHDEYWTEEMVAAASAARDAGVDLAFFAGNHVFGTVTYDGLNRTMAGVSKAGTPGSGSPDGNLWWDDPDYIDKKKRQALVGQANTGCCARKPALYQNLPWIVDAETHWVFDGTGFVSGDEVPGLLGYEPDAYDPQFVGVCSQDFTLLSRSPFTPAAAGGDSTFLSPWVLPEAHTTIYEAPSGAWVFSAGSTDWPWGLTAREAFTAPPYSAENGAPAEDGFVVTTSQAGSTQMIENDLGQGQRAWEAMGVGGNAFARYAVEGNAGWSLEQGYSMETEFRVVSGDWITFYYASGSWRYLPRLSIDGNGDLLLTLEGGGSFVLTTGGDATEYHTHRIDFDRDTDMATYFFDETEIGSWGGSATSQSGFYFGQGATPVDGVARFRSARIGMTPPVDARIEQMTRNVLDRMSGRPTGEEPRFFEAGFCEDTTPERMGWTADHTGSGDGAAIEDGGAPAWIADGDAGQAVWSVSPSAATEALAAVQGWRIESVLRVESGGYLTDYYANGSRRYMPILGLDGSGNLIVELEGSGLAPIVLATGAEATLYHTHEVVFDPATQDATYFFDGQSIGTWSGAVTTERQISFGQGSTPIDGVAYYRSMRFEILAPPAVPAIGAAWGWALGAMLSFGVIVIGRNAARRKQGDR